MLIRVPFKYIVGHCNNIGFTKWIHNWILNDRSEGVKNFDLFHRAFSNLKKTKHPFYIVCFYLVASFNF